MIPFFRKIRFRLASENQFLKYSRYAIGEIVLVVIGILIALQVNNANEQRRNVQALKTSLKGLQAEMEDNIGYLNLNINKIESDLKKIEYYVHRLSNSDPEKVPDSVIDSCMRKIGPIRIRTIRSSSYKNLIESGNINFIRNDSLKEIILGLEHGFQNYEKYTTLWNQHWEEVLRPYYTRNGNFFVIRDSIYEKPVPQTNFSVDPNAFVNNQEFLNVLLMRASIGRRTKFRFTRMSRILKERSALIDEYLASN